MSTTSDVSTHQITREPIRLSLRTYAPEELAALNVRLGRRGVAAFRPAEELLVDIEAGKRPTRAATPAWYFHPDERVQLALLAREDLTPKPGFRSNSRFRLEAVWATAYTRALEEGVVWTPVLDCIAAERRCWPWRDLGIRVLSSGEFADFVVGRPGHVPRYRTTMELGDLLHGWIQVAEPERIERLLRVRSDAFVGAALRHAHGISPLLLREILEHRPAVAPLGLRNGSLSERFRAVLKEWAFDDLLRAEERISALSADASNWDKWTQAYGARTLEEIALYARGVGTGPPWLGKNITDAEIERLLALLDMGGDPTVGPARSAARILLACVGRLQEPGLLKLVPHLDRRNHAVVRVVEAVHATPRVWRACLEHSPTVKVQTAVARIPEAVQVLEIRSLLSRSKVIDILRRVVEYASDEEFVRVFRKLVRHDLDAAANALARQTNRAHLLAKSDLIPFMESPEQSHRLLAITLMDVAAAEEPRPVRRRAR